MAISILSEDFDEVIIGKFITGWATYSYCLENLVPLIDKLDIQRTLQDTKFYQRLERDLIKGCIMPPITIAFIRQAPKKLSSIEISELINSKVEEAFILDGIQRLNTLKRTWDRYPNQLDVNRKLYLNILICSSMDNLLYRMITLNNGQKPMSARHQIEILTGSLVEFNDTQFNIVTEKEKHKFKPRYSVTFTKDTFVKGYLAFLANTTNIENKKIIEEKMDQLIADRIMDTEISTIDVEFTSIVELLNKWAQGKQAFNWLKNQNNFIGFCVGAKKSFNTIVTLSLNEVESALENYEKAFTSFKYSQIKVGKYRRVLGSHFIANLDRLKSYEELELIDELSQLDI
jgi:hypothetical protein